MTCLSSLTRYSHRAWVCDDRGVAVTKIMAWATDPWLAAAGAVRLALLELYS